MIAGRPDPISTADGAAPSRSPRTRRLAAVGAVGALVVAIVFATIGDGTTPPVDAGPLRRYGHAVVWALLAGCCTAVALDRGPRQLPRALGYTALAVYVGFLATVLFDVPL